MSNVDLTAIYALGHRLAEARREAIESREKHETEAANAEHEYTKMRAVAYARSRGQGNTDKGAELYANEQAADKKLEMRLAEAKRKSADLHIEEIERNQASVNKEIDVALKLGFVPEREAVETFGRRAA